MLLASLVVSIEYWLDFIEEQTRQHILSFWGLPAIISQLPMRYYMPIANASL
jgi:hypothetical protein